MSQSLLNTAHNPYEYSLFIKKQSIIKLIKILRNKFKKYEIDGYIIPKNDEFFSEYTVKDRIKTISNFTGSAGLAIVLRKTNYLFVDGRYTIQARQQSANHFKIIEIHKFLNKAS